MTDKTGRALVDFLDRAAEKGWLNKNTAAGYRVACQRILEIEPDWERLDLSTLEVEDFIQRFVTLKGGDYTPRSLETYKSRFGKAIQTYLDWAQDPSSWRRPTPAQRKRASRTSSSHSAEEGRVDGQKRRPPARPVPSDGMITYPFPVREDVDAQLVLPRDLRPEEVRRLVAFINALAIEGPVDPGE
jgi:hypothetical protein